MSEEITLTITVRSAEDLLLSLSALSPAVNDAFDELVAKRLKERDWLVEKKNWVPADELARELGCTVKHISRRLADPACPTHDAIRGKMKRLRFLTAHPRLTQFITMHLHGSKHKPTV